LRVGVVDTSIRTTDGRDLYTSLFQCGIIAPLTVFIAAPIGVSPVVVFELLVQICLLRFVRCIEVLAVCNPKKLFKHRLIEPFDKAFGFSR